MKKESEPRPNVSTHAREIYISAMLGLCAAGLVALPVLVLNAEAPTTRARGGATLTNAPTVAKAPKIAKAAKAPKRAKVADLVRDSRGRDKDKRRRAIRRLGSRRDKAAVDRLKTLAGSKDPVDRDFALEGLARTGGDAGAVTVAAACAGGNASACRSLQWSQGGTDSLTAGLASDDEALRSAAAFALARRGETEGVREIAEALLSAVDPEVRAEAVHTLEILGRKDDSVPALLESALASETHSLVRQVLQETLKQLK